LAFLLLALLAGGVVSVGRARQIVSGSGGLTLAATGFALTALKDPYFHS
jgi:hypothetical protein